MLITHGGRHTPREPPPQRQPTLTQTSSPVQLASVEHELEAGQPVKAEKSAHRCAPPELVTHQQVSLQAANSQLQKSLSAEQVSATQSPTPSGVCAQLSPLRQHCEPAEPEQKRSPAGQLQISCWFWPQ